MICVCSGDRAVTDRIVAVIEAEGFGAAVHARALDRAHSLALRRAGVAFDIRETFESALVFAGATMRGIGRDAEETATALADTRRRDADRMALDLARRRSPPADGTGARVDESALRAEEAPGRG